MHPRDFEILDVTGVDLVEAAVMVGLVGAVIGRPVVLGRLGIQRRVLRLRRRLSLRRRDGDQGSHRQHSAAGEISFMESHLRPPFVVCLLGRIFVATLEGCSWRQRLPGSEVRNRWHGPAGPPSRRSGSRSCGLSEKRAEDRAKDCLRRGRHVRARRHMRSLPALACSMLPPAMSMQCTMTCPLDAHAH
jgi:hypothetical protein